MKTRIQTKILLPFATAMAMLALASPAHAATMSASATPPAINGADIANYGAVTGNDKWWAENSGDGSAKGQSFTITNAPVLLKSVTYQVTASQDAEPTKQYVVRVGAVSGTSFAAIYSETATQTFTWNGGEYMTWTFATPVLLSTNKTYGVDIGMTSSTSSWQTGIPYINFTANGYAGGQFYDSGTSGIGTTNVTFASTSDRIFHLDLEDPMRPSPMDGATVPAGNVQLSWRNLTPNVGSDVWVDVWFGSNAGTLTKVVNAALNTTNTTVNAPGAATYYWRVDSYLNGAPTGTPVASKVFRFIVSDSDADGIPDVYELANTTPPSATALTPGGDDDSDGLTNLDEYQRGTRANLADTDGDTLNDGAEVAGAGSRPPTSPLLTDTDGDTVSDLAESNTGVWVGTTNRGTNPTKADTDGDGLSDGVENNTGTFVSPTNTGTNPLNSDTDGDGAGDWYEITASFTSPFLATEKPNVPYPLPDPDGSKGATNKPVKVYILSGQSNMVGAGTVNGTDDKSLETMTLRKNKFPNLVNATNGWTARQDVLYRGVISAIHNKPLVPGCGSSTSTMGPELGFGHIMGWYHDEPVLLLKSSIGNRSLGWDCLPPGSGRFAIDTNTYAGYGDYDDVWPTANGEPAPFVWYAGKQYDDYFLAETNMGAPAWADATYYYANGIQVRHNGQIYNSKGGAHTSSPNSEPGVGASWTTRWDVHSIINVVDVLDNWATQYTNWASQGFEIAGFVWWQGDKDRYNLVHATRYETNLVKLITSLRTYYSNRYPGKVVPNAPFVLATLGQTILGDTNNLNEKAILDAQLAVDGEAGNYPQFVGNVKTVYSHPLSEGGASNSHYDGRAGTYMLVGDALGRAMLELLTGTAVPTNDYSNWATNFPGVSLGGPNGDYDGDGRGNDYERIWGLNPTNAVSNNPFTFTASLGDGTFSYTRRDPALTGLAYTIWTSTNLVNWAQDVGASQTPGVPVNQVQAVSVTVSPALHTGPQLFMRVRAQ